MDSLTSSRQISHLEIVDTGRRRRWTPQEKLRIVEESLAGPRPASATARRHGISHQMLLAGRKAYRQGRLGVVTGFVAAVLGPEPPPDPGTSGRIEIVSSNGRVVPLGLGF